jgi:hypothetical protein
MVTLSVRPLRFSSGECKGNASRPSSRAFSFPEDGRMYVSEIGLMRLVLDWARLKRIALFGLSNTRRALGRQMRGRTRCYPGAAA